MSGTRRATHRRRRIPGAGRCGCFSLRERTCASGRANELSVVLEVLIPWFCAGLTTGRSRFRDGWGLGDLPRLAASQDLLFLGMRSRTVLFAESNARRNQLLLLIRLELLDPSQQRGLREDLQVESSFLCRSACLRDRREEVTSPDAWTIKTVGRGSRTLGTFSSESESGLAPGNTTDPKRGRTRCQIQRLGLPPFRAGRPEKSTNKRCCGFARALFPSQFS